MEIRQITDNLKKQNVTRFILEACPKTRSVLYTLCEIIRCGDNYINREL